MKGKVLPLVWNEWNKEHIKKHSVTSEEVEEIYHGFHIRSKSYNIRTLFLGRSKKGRLLTIAISYEKQPNPYVVSARDMSRKERKYYELQTKTN